MLEQSQSIRQDIVRLRRDLHAHPEIGFQEIRTSGVVADRLQELGFENVQTRVGRTGVVAELGPNDGPIIGIRADMDALPIQEETPHDFRSQNDGLMHACGHDCHTSILLGAAQLLKNDFDANGSNWRGRVRFLFQPCEEMFDENGNLTGTENYKDGELVE